MGNVKQKIKSIGKLIELAIKHRTGGILQAQDTPLLAEDIK
jgi:hypothetical protein